MYSSRLLPGPAGNTVPEGSQKLIEEILACIDDAVILLDAATSSIAFMNPAAGEIFGYRSGEWKGKPAGFLEGDRGPVKGDPGMIPKGPATMDRGETTDYLQRKDGARFPAQISYRPIFDESGGIRNILMVVRDLTGRDEAVASRKSPAWEAQIPISHRYRPIQECHFFCP